MSDFKLGDELVFVGGSGSGQHWSVKGMTGVVVGTRGTSVPENIMVECGFGTSTIVGEFRPERWQKVKALRIKAMTLDVAHRLVAFDCELAHQQAQYEIDKEAAEAHIKRMQDELAIQRGNIAAQMEEFAALKAEYGVED